MEHLTTKVELMSKYYRNKIKNIINTKKMYKMCRKELSKKYISSYFDLNSDEANTSYIIRVYNQGEVIAYTIIFLKENDDIEYGEIMILCANSPIKGVGTFLLKNAENFLKNELDIDLAVLCSLGTPFGFYKKNGYKLGKKQLCNVIGEDFDKNFDKKKYLEEGDDYDEEEGECPFDSHNKCVYMWKILN